MDQAGKGYWNTLHDHKSLQAVANPNKPGLRNHQVRMLDQFFRPLFEGATPDQQLLEIGCGNSAWLPYFHQRFGVAICGLDYSESGCEQSREILKREGVTGEIFCQDMFNPPPELLGRFDYVITFGVIEHFTDTPHVIESLRRYVKPGGLLISIIPNMQGLTGLLQKWVNPEIYAVHIPLGVEQVKQAHPPEPWQLLWCDHFMVIHLGVVNFGAGVLSWPWRLVKRLCQATTVLGWGVEKILPLTSNRWSSPHIIAVARRKQ
ncbi:SAM-dependent methyltransferase [Magnetococcus marinus]|nr:class I SAM-dependent methyltransferase [Magnetococcus marinus]